MRLEVIPTHPRTLSASGPSSPPTRTQPARRADPEGGPKGGPEGQGPTMAPSNSATSASPMPACAPSLPRGAGSDALRESLDFTLTGPFTTIPAAVRLGSIACSRPLSVAILAVIKTIVDGSGNAECGAVAITLYIRAAAERTRI